VILEGFLLSASSPDATSLAINLDCTGLQGETYLRLIAELEDHLSTLDQIYSDPKRRTRGRSIRGRYRRHLAGRDVMRSKKLTFVPYPSRIVNSVGNLRRELYQGLNRECLDLQREVVGNKHRVIYLLPFARAPAMMLLIDSLNTDIAQLNEDLTAMREREVPRIIAILEKYGVDFFDQSQIPSTLHDFSVDLRPVRLDPSVIEDIIEERYKEQFSRLKAEEQRGLGLLRVELDRQRVELVTKALEKLQLQIEAIASRMARAKFSQEQARIDIARIREIAESTGLNALATQVLDPLSEVINEPGRAQEVLGTQDVAAGVSLRIQGLINSL
jgi:hypothetical protein